MKWKISGMKKRWLLISALCLVCIFEGNDKPMLWVLLSIMFLAVSLLSAKIERVNSGS
jgi:hypothetical protein